MPIFAAQSRSCAVDPPREVFFCFTRESAARFREAPHAATMEVEELLPLEVLRRLLILHRQGQGTALVDFDGKGAIAYNVMLHDPWMLFAMLLRHARRLLSEVDADGDPIRG